MTYKILSLDGGGTWALIQAKVLIDLFGGDTKGKEILGDFDLVAANSGGALVAAGLIADMTPAAILALFLDQQIRRNIFEELPFYKRLLRIIGVGPQFSTEGKLQGLSQALAVLGSGALQNLHIPNKKNEDIRFLITAYDYDRDRVVFFRSDPASPASNFPRSGSTTSIVNSVYASSTAPVQYFDKPAEFGDKRYWDGGVSGFNNPVLAATLEAIAYGVPREEIRILSIGTGNTFLPVGGPTTDPVLVQQRYKQCLVSDVKKLATAVVADPPDTDTFITHVMLTGKDQLPADQNAMPLSNTPVIRMNPLIRPQISDNQWDLPNGCSGRDFERLAEMDLAVIDQSDVDLIKSFCDGWMTGHWINQPVRHGADLTTGGTPNPYFCEIGFPKYVSARAALASWLSFPS